MYNIDTFIERLNKKFPTLKIIDISQVEGIVQIQTAFVAGAMARFWVVQPKNDEQWKTAENLAIAMFNKEFFPEDVKQDN